LRHALTFTLLLALGAATAGCAAPAGMPAAAQPREGTASAGLGETASFGEVAVTPLRVEEESRCPFGVQCVQAGTVRLAVRIEQRGAATERVLRLEQPLRLGSGAWLTLAAVCPHPRHPGTIRPDQYHFTFALALNSPPLPFDFVCRE
jgi:hypothetical protein